MTVTPVRRALLSVSDKTGLSVLAQSLVELGVEVISTGGTSQCLLEAGVSHQQVEEYTGFPEMLDGRIKTLHPSIHGGILGKRDQHSVEIATQQMQWIDLVVVNFYPFAKISKQNQQTWDEVVDYIDIGGPTMVRAAAKNFAWVGVVVDPNDYELILNELRAHHGLTFETRKNLAEKAFALTAHYDAMIHHHFVDTRTEKRDCPAYLDLQLQKSSELRYGENPHQKACAYQFAQEKIGILAAIQHQGKPLSYNNILDAEAAVAVTQEFAMPACVIVKHANPCGVAAGLTIEEAYQHAYAADSQAAFGGIIALNRNCTKTLAEVIAAVFVEVVIAPAYTPEALKSLATKPGLRVLELSAQIVPAWEMKFITGGVLLQEKDDQVVQVNDLQVMTRLTPKPEAVETMLFAWRVLKHIKSNGILIAKNHTTIGIGAGQVSRIDAVELAVRKAGKNSQGAVLASDAFFPFRDSIDRIAQAGIRAIIQPGGSVRDAEVIAACDEHEIAMVFTGKRCFRH